jgi:hypothetical protein
MSRQSTAFLPPLAASRPGESATADRSVAGLSLTGWLLFLIGILVVASGYLSLRPVIFGLALHPMLIPVAFAFPLIGLSRISEFPQRILVSLSVFVSIYLLSIVNGLSMSTSEFFKTSAAFVTIVTCALLVRKRGDFVAGSLGLCIAVALLAAKGLTDESVNDVMDGANKNSYSLFALPPLLLTGFVCLRMPRTPLVIKATLIVCSLATLFVIFLGGNRSGYLGAVVVGLMLFWDQRGRGLILVGIVAIVLIGLLSRYGDTSTFDRRMQQTVEGTKSDNLRVRLFAGSVKIALENPIIGVSPQEFPARLSTSLGLRGRKLESHNVFAHVMGSSGLFCLLALGFVAWAIWFPFPKDEFPKTAANNSIFEARKLMRMLVILWFVRGMFSREILYSPAFNIAIGLAIGLYILAATSSKKQVAGNRPLAEPYRPGSA